MRAARSHLRGEPWLLAMVALATAAYAVFSLVRWAHLGANGFDLGIFDQTVWHFSRFEVPENTVKGFDNIWGDHFSPILVLLAPLYWVWDDARMLLLAQAGLLAAAAIPIFFYARGRLGRAPAHLLAGAYLVFWGVQAALDFDFHELAFVPVLLASLLLAADRERWGIYFGLLVALLCVKEDQAIVAVFIGLYLLTLRHWRQAAATIVLGVAWYVLVVGLLIPHFNPFGEFSYWSYSQFGEGPVSALAHAVTHPVEVVETLFSNATKRETLAYLFVPFLGLVFLSRTAVLLLPLLAQRFLSDTDAYWNTGGQYTLAVAAILFIGAADGLATVTRRFPAAPRAAPFVAAGTILILNVAFMATFPRDFTDLARPGFYKAPAWVADAEAALAAVPPGVSVATQDNLVPRLSHREEIIEITARARPTDYVIAEVFDRGAGLESNGGFPGVSRYLEANLAGYAPAAYFDGWLVLRSRALAPVPRPPALAPLTGPAAERARDAAARWGFALVAHVGELQACSGATDRIACVEPLGGEFRRDQAALAQALATLPAGLSPGCRGLADAATAAVGSYGGRLAALREAVLAGDDAAARAGVEGLQTLVDEHTSGYVSRFTGLCAPA